MVFFVRSQDSWTLVSARPKIWTQYICNMPMPMLFKLSCTIGPQAAAVLRNGGSPRRSQCEQHCEDKDQRQCLLKTFKKRYSFDLVFTFCHYTIILFTCKRSWKVYPDEFQMGQAMKNNR